VKRANIIDFNFTLSLYSLSFAAKYQ